MWAAERYGKDVYAYGDTIYVKDTIAVHNDEIVYEEGKSLSRFSLEENIESVIAKADYVGWDMLKGESFNGSVSVSDVSMTVGGETAWNETVSVGNNWISFFSDDGLVDAEDAKARAAAEVQNKSFGFITGTGSGEGNYKLLPGMHLTIKYVGAPFEGEYIADSVMHSFDYTKIPRAGQRAAKPYFYRKFRNRTKNKIFFNENKRYVPARLLYWKCKDE